MVIFVCAAVSASLLAANVPAPSQYLGFQLGADRQLADYKQIVAYLRTLANASGRVQVEDLGKTTLGNDLVMAVISSEENLKNKSRYQEIARKLADPRGLTQQQIDALVRDGKAIVLVTCNIHSSEIGSSQMAMEWAYALATAQDPETLRRLDNVILLLVPSLNPDGQIMEVEWYRKYLGTRYEGGRLPYLYHHYVGHDNNRDWYMLTQKETQAVNRAVYHEWLPQVWLDEHQMGSTGPRIFMPPYADPVAKILNPLIFRGINLIGTNMAWRLEEQHKSGAIYGYSFDAYWMGGTRNTAWWKNMFGLLTEVASANLATPVEVDPTELRGGSKGLIEYTKQVNYPNPWPGGTWRLRDIMDYERIISDALLETVSSRREDYLHGVTSMAMEAVKEAKPDEFYRVSLEQSDSVAAARLAQLMRAHGVEVLYSPERLEFLIPTAQPYGRFVTEILGVQRYPEVKPVAGPDIMPPYDVAAWSLPLLMGVKVEKVILGADARKSFRPAANSDWPPAKLEKSQAAVYAVSPTVTDATRLVNALLKQNANVSVARAAFTSAGQQFPAGTFLIEPTPQLGNAAAEFHVEARGLRARPDVAASKLKFARVGLYKAWMPNADEGWTRWVLDQYGFEPKSLEPKAVRAGNLRSQFDVIILPDINKDAIVEGRARRDDDAMKYTEEFPPEYTGGIGRDGIAALKQFVDQGGTIISLVDAGDFLADNFNIPVRNVLARARRNEFNCPGSLLRIYLNPNHPVAYGMPEEAAAFVEGNVAYQTAVPGPELKRSVVAWYPDSEEDVLLSGWIRGSDRLLRRAAVASFEIGKGKLVLLGFGVQHRGQTEGTFKLLFNSIRWGAAE